MPEVTVESIKHETDNAILCELADGREVWIPFSHCDRVTRRPDGSAVLRVSEWIANKEDL